MKKTDVVGGASEKSKSSLVPRYHECEEPPTSRGHSRRFDEPRLRHLRKHKVSAGIRTKRARYQEEDQHVGRKAGQKARCQITTTEGTKLDITKTYTFKRLTDDEMRSLERPPAAATEELSYLNASSVMHPTDGTTYVHRKPGQKENYPISATEKVNAAIQKTEILKQTTGDKLSVPEITSAESVGRVASSPLLTPLDEASLVGRQYGQNAYYQIPAAVDMRSDVQKTDIFKQTTGDRPKVPEITSAYSVAKAYNVASVPFLTPLDETSLVGRQHGQNADFQIPPTLEVRSAIQKTYILTQTTGNRTRVPDITPAGNADKAFNEASAPLLTPHDEASLVGRQHGQNANYQIPAASKVRSVIQKTEISKQATGDIPRVPEIISAGYVGKSYNVASTPLLTPLDGTSLVGRQHGQNAHYHIPAAKEMRSATQKTDFLKQTTVVVVGPTSSTSSKKYCGLDKADVWTPDMLYDGYVGRGSKVGCAFPRISLEEEPLKETSHGQNAGYQASTTEDRTLAVQKSEGHKRTIDDERLFPERPSANNVVKAPYPLEMAPIVVRKNKRQMTNQNSATKWTKSTTQETVIIKRTTDDELRAPEITSIGSIDRASNRNTTHLQMPPLETEHLSRRFRGNGDHQMLPTEKTNFGFRKTDVLMCTTNDELRAPGRPSADYVFKGTSITAAPLQIPFEETPHLSRKVESKADYEMPATEEINFGFKKADVLMCTTDHELRAPGRPSADYVFKGSSITAAPLQIPFEEKPHVSGRVGSKGDYEMPATEEMNFGFQKTDVHKRTTDNELRTPELTSTGSIDKGSNRNATHIQTPLEGVSHVSRRVGVNGDYVMPATKNMNSGFQKSDDLKRTTDHELLAPERQAADYGLKKSGITAVPLQIPLEGALHMVRMDGQNIGYDMKDTEGMNSGFPKTDILKRTTDDELQAPEITYIGSIDRASNRNTTNLQMPLLETEHLSRRFRGYGDHQMLPTEKTNFSFRKTDVLMCTTDDELWTLGRPSADYVFKGSSITAAPLQILFEETPHLSRKVESKADYEMPATEEINFGFKKADVLMCTTDHELPAPGRPSADYVFKGSSITAAPLQIPFEEKPHVSGRVGSKGHYEMPAIEEMNFGFKKADILMCTTDHELRAPEGQSADYGLKNSDITAVPLQIPLEGALHMGRMDGLNKGYDIKDTKGMNCGFQKTDILKSITNDELRAPEGPFTDYAFKGSSLIAAPLQIPLEGAPHVGSSVLGKKNYQMLATERMNFVFRKTSAPKRTTDDALPSVAYNVHESNVITTCSAYPLAAETYYDMDIRNNARKAGCYQKCPQAYAGVSGTSFLISPKNYRGPDNTEVSNSMLVSGRRHVVDVRRESGGYSYDFGYDNKPLSSDLQGCPPKLKTKTTDSKNLKNNWNFRRTHALERHAHAEKSGFIDKKNV